MAYQRPSTARWRRKLVALGGGAPSADEHQNPSERRNTCERAREWRRPCTRRRPYVYGESHVPPSLSRAAPAVSATTTRDTMCRTDSSNAPAIVATISPGLLDPVDGNGRSIVNVS